METAVRKPAAFYKNAYLYFLLVMLITIAAFFPSYFQRLTHTDAAHHFHGITATLWIVMLVVQPFLYTTGQIKAHRMLGRFSFVLAPLVVVSGFMMIQAMLHGMANYPPLIPYQLAFIDFFSIGLFIYFYAQAIRFRKNVKLHSRFITCTVLGPLIPTITRFFFFYVPGIDTFPKSLNASYVVLELVLVALLIDDQHRGKIEKPYVIALVLFVVQHVLMNFVSGWAWWRGLMDGVV